MPAILDASVKAGAEWVVVEQDRPAPGDTPINSVKLSASTSKHSAGKIIKRKKVTEHEHQ